MKPLATAFAIGSSFLALAGPACSGLEVGVTDDGGKYADDGGTWFYSQLDTAGMTVNRISVSWNPAHPSRIADKPFLDRALPVAAAHHIDVMFSVGIGKAHAITASRARPAGFAAFLKLLASSYPQVTKFIVGNEPNQPRFWQPQFDRRGHGVSGFAYEHLLALSYDALKQVNPDIEVIGVGLSPRGNDNPRARNNVSTSPVRFLHELGLGYRASARARPIMDALAFHPYPNPSSAADAPSVGYAWPNAGVPNLDRIKQAVWDEFHGTAQPTFAEWDPLRVPVATGEPQPLRFELDEVGWQARIVRSAARSYRGVEISRTVSERTQAIYYASLVRRYTCDRTVESLLFFHLVDEADLDRFQSGLVRANHTLRPSFAAVKNAIAETANGCTGALVSWHHATDVAGASAWGTTRGVVLRAEEGARYEVQVSGRTLARGRLRPYAPTLVRLRDAGTAVARLHATMNPARVSSFAVPFES